MAIDLVDNMGYMEHQSCGLYSLVTSRDYDSVDSPMNGRNIYVPKPQPVINKIPNGCLIGGVPFKYQIMTIEQKCPL